MLKTIREHAGLILMLTSLPFAHHYRPSVQEYLYGPKPTTQSRIAANPARITYIYQDIYRVEFDSNGDGTLNKKITGRLYIESLEDLSD